MWLIHGAIFARHNIGVFSRVVGDSCVEFSFDPGERSGRWAHRKDEHFLHGLWGKILPCCLGIGSIPADWLLASV